MMKLMVFVEIFGFNISVMYCSIGIGAVGFWFVNSSYLNLLFNKITIVSKIQ